jgi:hypothetical protein
MRQNTKRPIPSISSQVVGVCAALVGLAFAVIGGYAVVGGLTTGRTYSVALIVGDNTMVSRSSASAAFWTSIGLFSVSFVGGLIVGLGVLREVIVDHRRKVAAKKQEAQGPSA